MWRLLGCLFIVCGAAAQTIDFVRDVRPLLSDRCFACHGPDEKSRMANLRLDVEDAARAAIGSGKLIARVTHEKKALRMPPPGAPELTPQQVKIIERWVEQGAPWREHWSFIAPRRPEPPAVRNTSWPKNDIDRFVLARLEREGLKPSPPADKATLLRRVTLDLTGLPPTPAETDAFLRDRSSNAYEKVVDRLLASPHYGERMALPWLDIARYADTHGFHIDSHREMWPWRDWVIRAFNNNLRYDQFAVWQLAGDLLPNPTRDQLIASGFNRNHMINYEGGAIPEEYLVEYVVDRVEATSTAFLGLTSGCARCHDHKYDPIPQKDFYRLFAFFNTVNEKGLDGQRGNARPFLQLPDESQQAKLERLNARIAAVEDALDHADVSGLRESWEREELAKQRTPTAHTGLIAHYSFDGSLEDISGNYRHGRITKGDPSFAAGAVGRAIALDDRTGIELPASGERADAFAMWLKVSGRLDNQPSTLLKTANLTFWIDGGRAIGRNRRGSHLYIALPDRTLRTKTEVVTGPWIHVAANLAGEPALWIDQRRAELVTVEDAAPKPWIRGSIDDLRLYSRALTEAEVAYMAETAPAQATLAIPAKQRSTDQRLALLEYFFQHGAPENVRSLSREWTSLVQQREELEYGIPTTMIMAEMAIPRETKILARGDYRNGTDPVTPGVPAFLPPLPAEAPVNRLGLAQWLVAPDHPLTARVAVNRFWQMYFGHGIVKTAEDFGSQGEMPVHPELLDWLATEFVASGWDVKALQKKIVMSAAYQQSSRATPELIEKDPENRLLARGPRFRLPAEFIRDSALSVSGLLNPEMGGPGVNPYQPKGVWEDIAYGDTFSSQIFEQDHGSKLYRRSMYTFWKRTAPPPGLATFDAPDREKCLARRSLTNTPLQALVLLNDTTYVEAARALAARMMHEGGKDPLGFGYRVALNRTPQRGEREVLMAQYRKQLGVYKNYPEGVDKLLANGESQVPEGLDRTQLAAWTTVASVLLNLDEAVTKE
jgi:hypothetical protein